MKAKIRDGLPIIGKRRVFTPKDFAGNVLWLRADRGRVNSGTMSAVVSAGTTPPVITLTGTASNAVSVVKITCTLGGSLNTWTGTWSIDGITTTAFTSAATVAIGGGLTLNIAAGTANTNNTWTASPKVSTWTDYSGHGNNASSGTSAPVFNYLNANTNNTPSMDFTAASTQNFNIDSVAASIGGTAQPWTIMYSYICTTSITQGGVCIAGPSQYIITEGRNAAGKCELQCRNAAITPDITGAAINSAVHVFEGFHDGANINLLIDGSLQTGSPATLGGTSTLTQGSVGCFRQSSANSIYMTGSIVEVGIWNRSLNSAERQIVRRLFGSRVGLSL